MQQRWRTQPQQGDLVAIAASIAGELVGMAIAEQRPDQTAEIISLFVAPTVRQQGIGTRLLYHLQKRLKSCTQIQITYPVSPLTAAALEPMLRKLQWSTPTTSTVLAAGTDHPATPTQPETRFSLFSHGPRSP
ncbi:MAG: GNAT family N-acetyltransferase [Leptolyngbyaceae cyanobacterium]